MKELLKEFWYEEEGLQTVEIVLIIIVIVAIIAIFRNRLVTLVGAIFTNADNAVGTVKETYMPE